MTIVTKVCKAEKYCRGVNGLPIFAFNLPMKKLQFKKMRVRLPSFTLSLNLRLIFFNIETFWGATPCCIQAKCNFEMIFDQNLFTIVCTWNIQTPWTNGLDLLDQKSKLIWAIFANTNTMMMIYWGDVMPRQVWPVETSGAKCILKFDTNTFWDKRILKFETNTVYNFRQIHFEIWDKYILQFYTSTFWNWRQIYFTILHK